MSFRSESGVALGALTLWPPLILAPMAGVTDYPFRALCRRFAETTVDAGAARPVGSTCGLFVSEMITARPLVEGNRKTLRLAAFGPGESPRSLQIYGVDPRYVGEAVRRLVGEGRVDHIDMNFGCPAPKITRRGGGAAIPAKPRLLAKIVRAAVEGAGGAVPVTIKFRKGIDASLITFRDAGRVGQEEGCAAVGLHARTAAEFYSEGADWDCITELVDLLDIPVFGNGDIWEAEDAERMMAQTGCAGVIVGRGCLGRPWLFAELVARACGREPPGPPNFGAVAEVMLAHAEAMVAWAERPGALGERDESECIEPEQRAEDDRKSGRARARRARPLGAEQLAMRAFRKHASWYTKGFRGSAPLRAALMQIDSLQRLRALLETCDVAEPFPVEALRAVRGKRGRLDKVALPAGYRDQLDDDTPPGREAALLGSGG